MSHRVLLLLIISLVTGSASAQNRDELVRAVRAKGELAKESIVQRAQAGMPVEPLVRMAKEVERLGKTGQLQQADQLLDRLLIAIQESQPGTSAPAAEGEFGDPRPVAIRGLPLGAGGTPISTEEPFISRDGRLLLFNSAKQENNKDLHFAEWQGDHWRYRGEIGPGGNNPKEVQGNPTMDRAGNLYFVDSGTDTMVRAGRFQVASGALEKLHDVTGFPLKRVQLFAQKIHGNMGVELSADGDTAYFSRATWALSGLRIRTIIASDLLLARRQGEEFVYDESEARRILARINTDDLEYAASISEDGLELFFTRLPRAAIQSGQLRSQIMRATRAKTTEPFGQPEIIHAIGTSHFVEGPAISPDGKTLYYHQREDDKFRIYQVTRRGVEEGRRPE